MISEPEDPVRRHRNRRTRRHGAVAALVIAAAILTIGNATTVTAESSSAVPGTPRGAAAVIDAGWAHSCAILENGTVKGMSE